MYECFVKLKNYDIDVYMENFWDTWEVADDLSEEQMALIFSKKSIDLEHIKFIATSLVNKLKKFGVVKVKITQVIEDWS